MKLAEWGCTRRHPKTGNNQDGRRSKKRKRGDSNEEDEDSDASEATVRSKSKQVEQEKSTAPRDSESLETMMLTRTTTNPSIGLRTGSGILGSGFFDTKGK
jgi:hypothetical protein